MKKVWNVCERYNWLELTCRCTTDLRGLRWPPAGSKVKNSASITVMFLTINLYHWNSCSIWVINPLKYLAAKFHKLKYIFRICSDFRYRHVFIATCGPGCLHTGGVGIRSSLVTGCCPTNSRRHQKGGKFKYKCKQIKSVF